MDLSVIIPSFNEGHHLRTLTEKIRAILEPLSIQYEIWIIDDSTDDTPALIQKIKHDMPFAHAIHRKYQRGLGSAIVEGFRQSLGRCLIVIDGDLQHPPELFPEIYHLLSTEADLVIPSRFMNGGSDGRMHFYRKCLSWIARKIGQRKLKLRAISDCTSGYFGVKRTAIEQIQFNPTSWKILLEILVKGNIKTIREIPYHFIAQRKMASKMNLFEQLKFLRHVAKLAKEVK
ncbi:MAG: glycosyltransferase [Gammaproteobacteria bacterium]|nr:glycosyltransferase [Gammaproteobacteria bacterium]